MTKFLSIAWAAYAVALLIHAAAGHETSVFEMAASAAIANFYLEEWRTHEEINSLKEEIKKLKNKE